MAAILSPAPPSRPRTRLGSASVIHFSTTATEFHSVTFSPATSFLPYAIFTGRTGGGGGILDRPATARAATPSRAGVATLLGGGGGGGGYNGVGRPRPSSAPRERPAGDRSQAARVGHNWLALGTDRASC